MKKEHLNILYASLAVVGLAAAAASASNTNWPLIANGGSVATSIAVGNVNVVDNGVDAITVTFTISNDLDPANAIPTLMYFVSAEANCTESDFPLSKGNPIPGLYDESATFPDGVDIATLTLARPNCASPLVSAHASVKELGGVAGFNYVFPLDVSFRVALDTGSDPDASYFDTEFTATSGPLWGQTFNGWCVDVGHTINLNTYYPATAYSIFGLPAGPIGNIDKPQNLPGVMWLLNNFRPGDVLDLTDDSLNNPRTLTSGDIQLAIWYIVDNTQSTAGLGAYDAYYAQALAYMALDVGATYNPPNLCGLVIPIILVTTNDNIQTTIAQTTLAELKVPCEDITATAMAMNTSAQITEKGSVRYGEQFPGSNWFSYVKLPAE